MLGRASAGTTARNSDEPVTWHSTHSGRADRIVNAHDHRDGVVLYITGDGLERWTLKPSAQTAHQHVLDATPQAFGRINDRFVGLPHRYLCTVGGPKPMPFDRTVVYKHDLTSGTRQHHNLETGRHPGEFLFVADTDRRADEDGGWLLGVVHDDDTDLASLVVLDAGNLASPRSATVYLPRRIPCGQHGVWVPNHS